MSCEICNKPLLHRGLIIPGVTARGAHPKCALLRLVDNGWLPYRGITRDMIVDPKFIALLESIAEDPTRGTAQKKRRIK